MMCQEMIHGEFQFSALTEVMLNKNYFFKQINYSLLIWC